VGSLTGVECFPTMWAQEALWSYGNKTHLTYNEYLREIRDQRRMQLQHIVVKGQTGKTFDYSKSPHRLDPRTWCRQPSLCVAW
jgi:hypothetical protein